MTSIDRFLATLVVFSLSLLLFREAEVWAHSRHTRPDIVVSVSGAVAKPKVLKLPADARAIHAVERCGGLTSEANLGSVELARPLKDGDHLAVEFKSRAQIPPVEIAGSVQEEESVEHDSVIASAVDTPQQYRAAEKKKAGPRVRRSRKKKQRLVAPIGTVDVNRASAEELDSLPGVGPVLAERIIQAREMAPGGTFSSLEELETIRGIKGKTLLRLRPHLKLEGS